MIDNLDIKISNISFMQDGTGQLVHLRFNTVGGQININGYVVVTMVDFFANSSSTENLVELVRTELIALVNRPVAQ